MSSQENEDLLKRKHFKTNKSKNYYIHLINNFEDFYTPIKRLYWCVCLNNKTQCDSSIRASVLPALDPEMKP
jgi:hypothetical protein